MGPNKRFAQGRIPMLSIISPSKTMDFNCRSYPVQTAAGFLPQVRELAAQLKPLSRTDLEKFMKISPPIAELTHQRYQKFSGNPVSDGARQAMLVYRGDAFQELGIEDYGDKEFEFAQNHLRILSGLYGMLRPLDLIEPHRLEMAARLSGPWGKNLYEFWSDRITQQINGEMKESEGASVLVNLASNEYFKVIRRKRLKAGLLNIQFKEKKSNGFKAVAIHAKRARGLMANFIIQEKITDPEFLKKFTGNGYAFNPDLSTSETWVFSRE